MMKRTLLGLLLLVLIATPAFALGKWQQYAEIGGQSVSGTTVKYQKSCPGASIRVKVGGTSTDAALYSTSSLTGLSNPFNATSTGLIKFFAADGTYDITVTCTDGISYTLFGESVGDGTSAEVTIDSYGALDDGTTNNDTAITNAINAVNTAGGGIVKVPCTASSYHLTTAVTLTTISNVTIRGEGKCSKITVNLLDTAFEVSGGSRVRFESVWITGTMARAIAVKSHTDFAVYDSYLGPGATLGAPQSFGASVGSSDYAAGLWGAFLTGLVVHNTEFTGNGFGATTTVSSGDIILTGTSTKVRVTRSRLQSTAVGYNLLIQSDGAGQTVTEYWIEDNDISGAVTKSDNSAWGYGVALYTSGTQPSIAFIHNNRIKNVGGTGIYLPAATKATITDNILTNTCTTVTGGALAEGAIGVSSDVVTPALAVDITITGNQIHTSGKAGIRCDCGEAIIANNIIDATTGASISLQRVFSNVQIVSNTITNSTGGGILSAATGSGTNWTVANNNITVSGAGAGAYGISLVNVDVLTVSGNVVNGSGAYNLLMQGTDDFTVTGNTFLDANNAGSTFDAMFFVSATDGVVSGNTVGDTTSGPRYAISLNTASRVEVTGNLLLGWGTDAYLENVVTNVSHADNRFTTAARMGVSNNMVAGTITINTAEVRAGDTIQITHATTGGALGALYVSAINAGVSFTITSTSNTDTSTVAWKIVH